MLLFPSLITGLGEKAGGLLQEYKEGENLGYELLSRIGENGEFMSEGYVKHCELEGRKWVLITNRTIRIVRRLRKGAVEVNWSRQFAKLMNFERSGNDSITIWSLQEQTEGENMDVGGFGSITSQVLVAKKGIKSEKAIDDVYEIIRTKSRKIGGVL